MCYCFRAPIKPFFFDACQMTNKSCVLHLFRVPHTINILLGYLKDSNAAAHSVDTGISQAVRLKRIENDIECPIYMLESNNYHQSIERTRRNVVQKMIITTTGYQLWFSHSKLYEMIEIQIVYPLTGLLTVKKKTMQTHIPWQ